MGKRKPLSHETKERISRAARARAPVSHETRDRLGRIQEQRQLEQRSYQLYQEALTATRYSLGSPNQISGHSLYMNAKRAIAVNPRWPF